MFPLEMYAPKSDVAISGFGSPNVVGSVGARSVASKKEIDPKIDKLIIRLGEEIAAQSLEEERVAKIDTKIKKLPEQPELQPELLEVNQEELVQEISKQVQNINKAENRHINKEVIPEEVYIHPELPHFSPEELAKMTSQDIKNIGNTKNRTANQVLAVKNMPKASDGPELPYFDDNELLIMNSDIKQLKKGVNEPEDRNLPNSSYSDSKQAIN